MHLALKGKGQHDWTAETDLIGPKRGHARPIMSGFIGRAENGDLYPQKNKILFNYFNLDMTRIATHENTMRAGRRIRETS